MIDLIKMYNMKHAWTVLFFIFTDTVEYLSKAEPYKADISIRWTQ